MNTGRSNLTVVNQVVYVKDFDVEIAQAASIADPIIDVVNDGVILDVRPVVSADRRFITLELRPTIANLTRPIEQRVTTPSARRTRSRSSCPEVDIRRVRTSIPMPDGADRPARRPEGLRPQGPVVRRARCSTRSRSSGAFFDRKGKFVANSKLLILLNANIVIMTEHEPTNAQIDAVKVRAIRGGRRRLGRAAVVLIPGPAWSPPCVRQARAPAARASRSPGTADPAVTAARALRYTARARSRRARSPPGTPCPPPPPAPRAPVPRREFVGAHRCPPSPHAGRRERCGDAPPRPHRPAPSTRRPSRTRAALLAPGTARAGIPPRGPCR